MTTPPPQPEPALPPNGTSPPQYAPKWMGWILVATVGAIALAFRATDLGTVLFNIDEAAVSIYASQIAHFRQFHLTGVLTSQGFHNPPLFLYLLAPFFIVTPDPRFAGFGMALGGAFAVVLVILTVRRLGSLWTAAVTGGALLALSPTAIEHSRRLWGHDTILPFAAMACYATVRGVQERRPAWLGAAMVACAAAQACHLSGVLLWIVPLGALVLFRPPGIRRSLAIGAIALAFVYLPWFVHDSRVFASGDGDRAAFEQTRLIANVALGRADFPQMESPMPAWQSWLFLLGDQRHSDLLGPEHPQFLAEGLPLPLRLFRDVVLALVVLACAGWALRALWRVAARRNRDVEDAERWTALFGATALAPLVLFTVLPVTTVPAYQLPALVPLVLVAGLLTSRLIAPFTVPRRALLIVFCAGLGAYSGASTYVLRSAVRNAPPETRVSATLEHKLDAIIHITQSGETDTYAIAQDNRSMRAGVDFWVLYLHFWISGDPAAPVRADAPRLFVVRDNLVAVPEGVDVWLADKPVEEFGPLRVYRLEGTAAAQWREAMGGSPNAEE